MACQHDSECAGGHCVKPNRMSTGSTGARIRIRHSFIAKYGSTIRTPRLVASPDEIARHHIDATTGFVLALIGSVSVEQILDIVPKPENETLAILRRLIDLGIVAIERPPGK